MRHENLDLPSCYDASFERIAECDDPNFRDGENIGQQVSLNVELRVHPNSNGIIVINYPGYVADIDGFANKYANLAGFLQENIGAVLRTNNPHYAGFDYSTSVKDHLRAVIDYSLQHSEEIAGKRSEDTELYLIGTSAGASAVAAVAHEYPQVKKMLLMAPSGDAGEQAVKLGLSNFTGECHIVIGQNDEVVGVDSGRLFASMATSATVLRTAVIPDCGHQFRGELNGRIMSAAPIWAFKGLNDELPNPADGIFLYA